VAPLPEPRPATAEDPIALDQTETIDALRSVLAALGYTGEAVRNLLGDDAYQAREREVPVHVRRLRSGTPLELAIKLFFLGMPVARREVERALAPIRVDDLRRLGVVEGGEMVQPAVRLVPHADLLLAGNRYPGETSDGAPADYVATVTAPSAVLGCLTVRRPVATSLDIGTGSGVQALWLARHSERVVAVDVNRRALNLAAFNARLNGIENIEFREGSLFGSVAGERFDVIVCNAPYVVSPDARYAYRDSGSRSDSFSERLVRETPAHLNEGGFAHLLVGWILDGADWAARPRSWVEGCGCDCWLLLGVQRDPVTHAAVWNDELALEPERYGETLDRWLDYLAELGAGAVAEGAVNLRRRTRRRNWFRADPIPSGQPTPASDHVLRVFAAHDYLSEPADERELLDETLGLVDRVRIEQELACRDGGYLVQAMTVVLDEGLGFRAGVDQNTAALLPFLDGTRPLREAVVAASRARALDPRDLQAFTIGALEIARRMLELGFLTRRAAVGG
jgi:methylase of polypeptide subunit release factors